MLTRVFAAAVLVLAFMLAVKDGRVLSRTGLTGSCSTVQTVSDGSSWEACRSGRLEGAPDLRNRGCTSRATQGGLQYWLCPAAVESSPIR